MEVKIDIPTSKNTIYNIRIYSTESEKVEIAGVGLRGDNKGCYMFFKTIAASSIEVQIDMDPESITKNIKTSCGKNSSDHSKAFILAITVGIIIVFIWFISMK